MESDAVISGCEKYRYELTRTWDKSLGVLNIIGLNPSTADAIKPDPTITKCIHFAKEHGYGSLIMTNLFAYRSTEPKGLRDHIQVQDIEDIWLKANMIISDAVLIAWGGNADKYPLRVSQVAQMLLDKMITPYYLTKITSGQPGHPLYLKNDTRMKQFDTLKELAGLV